MANENNCESFYDSPAEHFNASLIQKGTGVKPNSMAVDYIAPTLKEVSTEEIVSKQKKSPFWLIVVATATAFLSQ